MAGERHRVPVAGERIPTRSVTPVAMQTGVQSTSTEMEDAPVVHLTLRCAERGIGSRFAWQPG
jgi:hypothetical protein